MRDDTRSVDLGCGGETPGAVTRCRRAQRIPSTHHIPNRFVRPAAEAADGAGRGERTDAERGEVIHHLHLFGRNHFDRRSSTRAIFAPRALSRSSMRSYPRSIWATLLMVLSPSAASAAVSIAMPARMSGD